MTDSPVWIAGIALLLAAVFWPRILIAFNAIPKE